MIQESAYSLVALGGMLLLGIATDLLGRHTFLPRVSLLVILGLAVGQSGFDLIPSRIEDSFELIASITLTMIGFLLGGKLTRKSLSQSRSKGIWISASAAFGTAAVVTLGLWIVGAAPEVAILLGCIASATAPAATVDVVVESKSKSPFAELLLLVVALDDAWGLILFSCGVAIVSTMQGLDGASSSVITAAQEIGGAAILGLLIGLPAAYLTGRIRPGEPMLTEALALVFICGGLSALLGVSFLIASMVMGAAIANLARHHDYPFHAIEDIEWPFLVVFFVLAGASLDIKALFDIGLIGAAYVIFRVVGKIVGVLVGGRLCGVDAPTRRWMGLALLPQAGVAIGMALVANSRFPELGGIVLTLIVAATIIFEIIGPAFTRLAIRSAGGHDG
jgi:Kef-type K+ transport system membrane component KefB